METVILLVSVASLSTNIYLALKIKKWFSRDFIELKVEPVINYTLEPAEEILDPVIEDQLLQVPSKQIVDDESKYAWRNATGLPASGPPSVSPSTPAPKSGPLERPYGFPG